MMYSFVVQFPVTIPAIYPPQIPKTILSAINNGLKIRLAMILGKIKKFGELTPIMSKASICSVTRMVPMLEAIYDPTFPARIREIMVGENSKIKTALVAKLTNTVGIGMDAVWKLLYICIATTAPINREVKRTNPKELTPKS